ncbi:MAG: AAA family ATPase [Myxococcota bacterium]
MPKFTCAFYSASASDFPSLAAHLEAEGTVQPGLLATDPSELLELAGSQRLDAVVADLGLEDPAAVLELLDKLPTPRPALVVIGPRDESGVILRAMRMGVREYFETRPTESDLRVVLERIAAERAPESDAPARPARVVAVMGAKGGVGATVVACQLAASLKAQGASVAVVDLNLPLGDVALHFDIQPSYSLANIAREDDKLDSTYLRTLLQGPPDGVQILPAPTHAEEAELVRGSHVERVLQLLRGEFEWVIVDVARDWGERTVRALDLADQILLVTLLDVPTLNHTREHIDLLARLGHTGNRVRLLANRHGAGDSVLDKDLAEFLDRPADFRVPNDYHTTVSALNRGISVAEVSPRSGVARAFEELAVLLHDWCGVERRSPDDSKEGVLARAVRMLRRS